MSPPPEPGTSAPPRGARDVEVPPPTNRMVVAVLSLVGFFVALYLFVHYVGWTGSIICGVGDCAAVQASDYSWVGPIPVPAIGMAGYVLLLVLSLVGLQPGRRTSRGLGIALLTLSTVGVAYSAWLTWLEAAVIRAWCQWCVTSAVIMTLIFLASLPEARRSGDTARAGDVPPAGGAS